VTSSSEESANFRSLSITRSLCATDPARAARRLVDDGFTARYDYAKEALRRHRDKRPVMVDTPDSTI
jgi:ATP-dependent helicase YprA (DUF1998 family)